MEDMKPDNEEIVLKPIPIEQDTKNEEDDGLIPLPIEESSTNHNDGNNHVANNNMNNNIDNDTEMRDKTTSSNIEEMVIEEEEIEEQEEEGGIIEEIVEEEEEAGGIIQTQTTTTTSTTSRTENNDKSSSPPKPQPKSSSNNQPKEEDKDRARSHALTTDTSKARYLNIHLMESWSNTEVLGWLTHRFGLWGQQYVPMFSNKKIDGNQLIKLTENELKTEFNVTKPLHLVRMSRDITDAKRSIDQIKKLISPCYMDGGNAASKMMRFGPKEVYEFAIRIPALKFHAQTFRDRHINGRVLLEANEEQLLTAMKLDTVVDAQTILEFINEIKKEDQEKKESQSISISIGTVYDVWSSQCKINETRFKLLPQHIRDYSKPAPTYYPPPQQHGYGGNIHNNYNQQNMYNQQRGQQQQRMDDDNDGTPALYEVKSVLEWNTEDCINWLGQIKESKVDLRVRYTQHFEQIKMDGPTLLNMTPSTLSSICCITTKTHLKQLVKAIDKIRDHLVFTGFGQLQHVKEFTTKYGGGYNFPPIRYDRYDQQQRGATTTASSSSYDQQQRGRERRISDQSERERQQQFERQQQREQQQQREREQLRDQQQSEQPQQAQNQQQPQQQQQQQQEQEQEESDKTGSGVAECFVCHKTGNVMRCSQCKAAFYCSREHQVSDWARHSKECQQKN